MHNSANKWGGSWEVFEKYTDELKHYDHLFNKVRILYTYVPH